MQVELTCSMALAVYVMRIAGNVPNFIAFLNTSVEEKFKDKYITFNDT